MSPVFRIACEEWRYLIRERASTIGLALFLLLSLIAIFNAWDYQSKAADTRARYQESVDEQFASQPDRHPHRVAHYGHFLFRPANPLSSFDSGIDAYTGNTIFLEAHRQNSANFGDVRQASLLVRFGTLTPAFVLQNLAPLLLLFIGYACIARERESGTLRVLLAQGLSSHALVIGKLLSLSGIAALLLFPSTVSLCWMAVTRQVDWFSVLMLSASYSLWLMVWISIVVLVSMLVRHSRVALMALLGTWTILVVLIPRLAPEIASSQVATSTRFEDAIHVDRQYRALGDAHNPNDTKFRNFQQSLLNKYGVSRVEDLPVNYKGMVAIESERSSSELFNRYALANHQLQAEQNHIVDNLGLLSPLIAVKRISMTVTTTDLPSYRSFLEQTESYRYELVQHLNHLQASQLNFKDDTTPGKDNRISSHFWQMLPEFAFQPADPIQKFNRAWPSMAVLLAWLALLFLTVWIASGRLARGVK